MKITQEINEVLLDGRVANQGPAADSLALILGTTIAAQAALLSKEDFRLWYADLTKVAQSVHLQNTLQIHEAPKGKQ